MCFNIKPLKVNENFVLKCVAGLRIMSTMEIVCKLLKVVCVSVYIYICVCACVCVCVCVCDSVLRDV